MSPLLAFAVVLLVIVAGLAWFQRRATRDLVAGVPRRPADTPSTQVLPTPSPTPDALSVSDPVIGDLTFDGIDVWTRDEDLHLGGHDISVVVVAGPEGPQDLHRSWVQAALARYDALEAEARALLVDVLEPLEIGRDEITPWQIMVGPGDDPQVFEGRLTYGVVHEEIDELYVRSTELWDYLEPHLT